MLPHSAISPKGAKFNSQERQPLETRPSQRKPQRGESVGVNMPQSFASMHMHVIFSTKNRKPMIDLAWKGQLCDYLGGICKTSGYPLLTAGGIDDHIHLLISMDREHSISEIVRTLKSNSSKWIHQESPESRLFALEAGYGAFAVSFSNLDAVKRYIANQESHHKQVSF